MKIQWFFSVGVAIGLMGCESATDKIVNDNPNGASTEVKVANPVASSPLNNNAPEETEMGVVDGASGAPQFSFTQENHDFGTINQGDKPQTTFTFTNTGDAPLIITQAKGSCGCTVPQWPTEPIAPGATGQIDVVFDSTGKSGRQAKTVTLTANTVPNTKVLSIAADVVVPEN